MCALSSASAAASPNRTTSRNSSSVNSWKPGAVDVERALRAAPAIERHDDQRLGIGRGVGHEADARIELGPVREHGLAVLDGPAGDPDAVRERLVCEHLAGVLPGGVDGLQLAGRLVRLVERDVVVGDQLPDRVRDPGEGDRHRAPRPPHRAADRHRRPRGPVHERSRRGLAPFARRAARANDPCRARASAAYGSGSRVASPSGSFPGYDLRRVVREPARRAAQPSACARRNSCWPTSASWRRPG